MKKLLGRADLSGTPAREDFENIPKVHNITDKNHPTFIQDVGNLTVQNIQHWVDKNGAVEIFDDNEFRRGFVITNNGGWTIYIGITDDIGLLKTIGTPIYAKGSFSSALFQGRLWCVADDSAGTNSVDVRIWEEQL